MNELYSEYEQEKLSMICELRTGDIPEYEQEKLACSYSRPKAIYERSWERKVEQGKGSYLIGN